MRRVSKNSWPWFKIVMYRFLTLTYNSPSWPKVAKRAVPSHPFPPVKSPKFASPLLPVLHPLHAPVPCRVVLDGHFPDQGPHYTRFSVFIYSCVRYTPRDWVLISFTERCWLFRARNGFSLHWHCFCTVQFLRPSCCFLVHMSGLH